MWKCRHKCNLTISWPNLPEAKMSLRVNFKLNFFFFNQLASNRPAQKTSLGESLAKSHAYNPIRGSRRDAWRARKVSPKVSPRVSDRLLARLSVRLLARLLARLSALAKRFAESLKLDYMHDSFRDSSFYVALRRIVIQHYYRYRLVDSLRFSQ